MGEYKIALLPGDGIGPEVLNEGKKVMQVIASKFGHVFAFEEAPVGGTAIDRVENPYPDQTHDVCIGADAVLFGAIGDPKYDNDPTAKVRPETRAIGYEKKN